LGGRREKWYCSGEIVQLSFTDALSFLSRAIPIPAVAPTPPNSKARSAVVLQEIGWAGVITDRITVRREIGLDSCKGFITNRSAKPASAISGGIHRDSQSLFEPLSLLGIEVGKVSWFGGLY